MTEKQINDIINKNDLRNNVFLFLGPPGSGKTTLAHAIIRNNLGLEIQYYNYDENSILASLNGIRAYQIHFLDGLFNDLKVLKKSICGYSFNIEYLDYIIVMNTTEEQCYQFDRIRSRSVLASATIKKWFEEDTTNKIISLIKKVNPKIKILYYDNDKEIKKYIFSGWKTLEEGDTEFNELDEYLEKNYSQTTFLQYKRIQKKVVKDVQTKYDYYDSQTNKIRYFIAIDDITEVFNGNS